MKIVEAKNAKDIPLALVYNNLAWSYLLKSTTEPNALEKADKYSTQALAINDKIPNLLGTRSCILVEIGELKQAIKILEKIIKINQPVNEKTNSVIGFLYLVYAYYLQEDCQKSAQYWQKIKNHQDLKIKDYNILFQHILKQTDNLKNLSFVSR